MANASDALELAIGTHLFLTDEFTKPAQLGVALFTTMPAEGGSGGVEVSGGAYARVFHNPGDSRWSPPVGGDGIFSNIGAVQFPNPSGGDWGNVVGFGLFFDSVYMIGNTFSTSFVVNNGDPAPVFNTGELFVTIA